MAQRLKQQSYWSCAADLDLLAAEMIATMLHRCRHCQQLLRGLIKHVG